MKHLILASGSPRRRDLMSQVGLDFTVVTSDAKIYIPMEELVDKGAELKRLNKELKQVEKMLAQDEGKLNNPGFMSKAPEKVIEKIKGQAEKEREKIALIHAAMDALK